MKFIASTLTAACVLALLSACGGSGDDGSPPSTTAQAVAITPANESGVARATFNGGFSIGSVAGATNGSPTSSPASALAAQRVLQRVAQVALNQRKRIASGSVHPATGTSETDPCDVSGSLATTWNDVDNNNALSAGDVITANFQQCQESSTESFNGALTITLTGTPAGTQFTANASFQNVTVVEDGATYTLSGAVALSETDTDTLASTTFTVGSGGLAVSIASTAYSDAIVYDSGMVVESSFLAGGSSQTLNGSFTSQSIGGRVTLSTLQPLLQQDGDTYPHAGEVLITGASGSTLLATVLNNAQVQLQVDANGDGTVDSTTTVAWTSLIP